jgi:hypothetical protein
VKVGRAAAASDNAAVLPAGRSRKRHVNVSGSPSGSVEPVPSSITSEPVNTSWSGPASAVGARLPAGSPQSGSVQRNAQMRPSVTVISPSLSASRGSSGPVAGWLRAAAISARSLLSTSLSKSASHLKPAAEAAWPPNASTSVTKAAAQRPT